jgi:hypothetical protein
MYVPNATKKTELNARQKGKVKPKTEKRSYNVMAPEVQRK